MIYGDNDHRLLNRIFSLLSERGIKQREFASALGLPEFTVTNWKKGQSFTYLKKLDAIADYFGMTVEELTGGEKEPSEMDELLEELKNRPDLKVLFSVAKDASAEDIYKAIGMLSVMREHRNG